MNSTGQDIELAIRMLNDPDGFDEEVSREMSKAYNNDHAGRSERKPIFIEPYWRGPEESPIAVRSHQMAVV